MVKRGKVWVKRGKGRFRDKETEGRVLRWERAEG